MLGFDLASSPNIRDASLAAVALEQAGTNPVEACLRVLAEFGGVERVKDECRDVRWETHADTCGSKVSVPISGNQWATCNFFEDAIRRSFRRD